MIETNFYRWMSLKEAGTIPTQPATIQGQQAQGVQQQQTNPQAQMQQGQAQGFSQKDIDNLYSTLSQYAKNGLVPPKDFSAAINKLTTMKQQAMSAPQQAQNPQMQASQNLMQRAATGNPQAGQISQ